MKVTVHILNAFTQTENGGNPAGVVLSADHLSESEMLAIAAKVGFSETAFVLRSDQADYRIRFFTPQAEVDLCGHATIAAFSLMLQEHRLLAGAGCPPPPGPSCPCTALSQETNAGVLQVEIHAAGTVYMHQNRPLFCEEIDKGELSDSLNIHPDALMDQYPAQIVSTGLRDILIPVKTLDGLLGIKPDFHKIQAISRKYDVIGYHLFTLETMNSSTAHCRNFAPLYDIPEEAATGTSNGALGCYLYKYGLVSEDQAGQMTFEQGYSMQRPSEILTSLTVRNREIVEVKVGGVARKVGETTIETD